MHEGCLKYNKLQRLIQARYYFKILYFLPESSHTQLTWAEVAISRTEKRKLLTLTTLLMTNRIHQKNQCSSDYTKRALHIYTIAAGINKIRILETTDVFSRLDQ